MAGLYSFEMTQRPHLPASRSGHAALVLAVDHLFQARHDVGDGMIAQFDHDPAPPHLVSDGPRRAGPGEGVKNEVAGVRGNLKDAMNQPFGFRGIEWHNIWE